MLPPKINNERRNNHRGAVEQSVVGRWFYGIVNDDTTPESDQEAEEIATNRAIGQTRHGLKASGVVLAFLHTNHPTQGPARIFGRASSTGR